MTTLADFRLPKRLRRTLVKLAPLVVGDQVDDMDIAGEVVDTFELIARSLPTHIRVGIIAGLHAFEHSARATPRGLGRGFSEMGRGSGRAHFDAWWSNPAGHQIAKAVKMFLAMATYDHPKVQKRLGYDPAAWIAKVKTEREARYRDVIAAHEVMLLAPSPLLDALEEARKR